MKMIKQTATERKMSHRKVLLVTSVLIGAVVATFCFYVLSASGNLDPIRDLAESETPRNIGHYVMFFALARSAMLFSICGFLFMSGVAMFLYRGHSKDPLIDSSAASETDEDDQTDGDGAEGESPRENK